MKEYRMPTSDAADSGIWGLNIKDAVVHNLKKVATTINYDKDTARIIRKEHPHDEVWMLKGKGILGGKGGVIILMRNEEETFETWIECPEGERPEEPIKIRG